VLFLSLPYPDAARLVSLTSTARGQRPAANDVSYPTFADWSADARSLTSVSAYVATGTTLTGRGDPAVLEGVAVTPNLFQTLAVLPALGRTLMPADASRGAARVVVVSDALWRERLDRNPAVVGESLTLDSVPYTIVGVMASSFRFPHLDPAPQLRRRLLVSYAEHICNPTV
jgi:hypothetical protein